MSNKQYRLCPECTYFCRVEEPDQYCSICGAHLIETCISCEQPIDNPYAKYCKFCGAQYPGRSHEPNPGTSF